MSKRLVVAAVVAVVLVALPTSAVAHGVHHHRPAAHVASCGTQCTTIANAYPGWVCDLQGGIVAAGIAIVSDGASVVWSILGGSSWTAGCHAIQDMVFSSATASKLRQDGVNCFYTWSQPHRQGIRREKCESWYA